MAYEDTLIGMIQSIQPTDLNNDFRIYDITPVYRMLTTVPTPLLNMAMANNMQVRRDPRFEWLEANYPPFQLQATADYNASTTTITLSSNEHFRIGTQLRNLRTNEVMRVEARLSTPANSLTVERGIGNAGVGVIGLTGDYLMAMGTAQPEGFTAADPTGIEGETVYNYTQIFDEYLSYSITKVNMDTPEFTKYENQLKKKLDMFMRALEANIINGKRDIDNDTTSGEVRRSTGGIYDRFSRVLDYSATPATITFEEYADWLVDYVFGNETGEDNVIIVHGRNFMKYFFDWEADFIDLPRASDQIGTPVRKVVLPNGQTANIMFHPFMNRGELAGTAFSMLPEQLGHHTMQPMQVNEGIQPRNQNRLSTGILNEVGWHFQDEKLGAMIRGVLAPTR